MVKEIALIGYSIWGLFLFAISCLIIYVGYALTKLFPSNGGFTDTLGWILNVIGRLGIIIILIIIIGKLQKKKGDKKAKRIKE